MTNLSYGSISRLGKLKQIKRRTAADGSLEYSRESIARWFKRFPLDRSVWVHVSTAANRLKKSRSEVTALARQGTLGSTIGPGGLWISIRDLDASLRLSELLALRVVEGDVDVAALKNATKVALPSLPEGTTERAQATAEEPAEKLPSGTSFREDLRRILQLVHQGSLRPKEAEVLIRRAFKRHTGE